MGCGSHPLCAPLQFAGDSSDLEISSLEDQEPPALAAADAVGTHGGDQGSENPLPAATGWCHKTMNRQQLLHSLPKAAPVLQPPLF